MARKVLYVFALFFFCAAVYHHYLPDAVITSITATVAPPPSPPPINSSAVLLPDWEVLVIVSAETNTPPTSHDGYFCLFDTGDVSPARFSGILQFPDRATFSCILPEKSRGKTPLRQPVLLSYYPDENQRDLSPPPQPLMRWSYLVYDSLTTEDDIVLFVKLGDDTRRQEVNREPSNYRCVFGDDTVNGVKTTVTSSTKEVFRCKRPDLTAVNASLDHPVKISLEIVAENRLVPSVAFYTPPRKLESKNGKSLLCATTIADNVSKFLREWVFYHSKIGVEKFIFYDNGNDQDLGGVTAALTAEGFGVSTYFWRWPETQESGFSHSAIHSKDACKWMMFLDADEFLYSPAWDNSPEPSKSMFNPSVISQNSPEIGQIIISSHEFGPSGQSFHPPAGVTQGYSCRRRDEYRHKSIILLDAIDDSLFNVIRHFRLKQGYKNMKMNTAALVVNHYKYQAWPEFQAKSRRRVSAFVLDSTKRSWSPNLDIERSHHGLGYTPVEPKRWVGLFCDVEDERLKNLALKWFGIESGSGIRMAWER